MLGCKWIFFAYTHLLKLCDDSHKLLCIRFDERKPDVHCQKLRQNNWTSLKWWSKLSKAVKDPIFNVYSACRFYCIIFNFRIPVFWWPFSSKHLHLTMQLSSLIFTSDLWEQVNDHLEFFFNVSECQLSESPIYISPSLFPLISVHFFSK